MNSQINLGEPQVLATGLRFPEGPVACDDGSVLLVEIAGERLTRVCTDGTVVARTGQQLAPMVGSGLPTMVAHFHTLTLESLFCQGQSHPRGFQARFNE